MTELRADLPEPPMRIAMLPVDHRGYPVPWFVAWERDGVRVPPGQGTPDHRLIGAGNVEIAIALKVCWICGEPIAPPFTFPIGPMCAITRTTSEPPSHHDCATWSVQACPFLTRPWARRRENNIPAAAVGAPGNAIMRNPGAMALWATRSFKAFRVAGGLLITVGKPTRVEWWVEGREATREEVVASIDSGCPTLLKEAVAQGPAAIAQLEAQKQTVTRKYLPRS